MAWVLGTNRGGVVVRRLDSLDAIGASRFDALVSRRERREPLQYLTGEQEFRGLAFKVDRRVLVPRPETEGVVDAVLGLSLPPGAAVVDLGTGSGCIAVAIAVERPDLRLYALDLSAEALELARGNAARHGVGHRISFLLGDLADPRGEWLGPMDAVVSNPPYVSEVEMEGLSPEVREYEPRMALLSGPTGLEVYQALAPAAYRLLRPGGALVLELGFLREAGARRAVGESGFGNVEVLPDLRGIPRVLVARRF